MDTDALLSGLYTGNEAAALATSILHASVPQSVLDKVEELATDEQLSELDASSLFVILLSVPSLARKRAVALFRQHRHVMSRATVAIALHECMGHSLKYFLAEGIDITALEKKETINLKLGRALVCLPRNVITHLLQSIDPSQIDINGCRDTLILLAELPIEHENAGTLLVVIRAMAKRRYARIYTALRDVFDVLVSRVNLHAVYGDFSLLGYLTHQRSRKNVFTASEKLRAADMLLSAGAEINQMSSGISPLMWAATVPSEGMLELLLSRGADDSLSTEQGKTAICYAAGKEQNVEILKDV